MTSLFDQLRYKFVSADSMKIKIEKQKSQIVNTIHIYCAVKAPSEDYDLCCAKLCDPCAKKELSDMYCQTQYTLVKNYNFKKDDRKK